MRVFVYFNLHKQIWSVKSLECGFHKNRVILHARSVLLEECVFQVSEAGRQRVIQNGRKDVHAGVVGSLKGVGAMQIRGFLPQDEVSRLQGKISPYGAGTGSFTQTPHWRATYNPYKGPTFVYFDQGKAFPLHSCQETLLHVDSAAPGDTRPIRKSFLVRGLGNTRQPAQVPLLAATAAQHCDPVTFT